jgi:hypothetical protein
MKVLKVMVRSYSSVRGQGILMMICTLLFTTSIAALSQVQKDLGDLVSNSDPNSLAEPELRKLYLPVLPIIGYAPANGFIIGAGIAPGILLDSASHTHISSALANVQLTSKRQINFNFRHNIYLSHDKWIFQGDWRALLFSQSTYGLGIMDLPGAFSLNAISIEEEETGEQPMRFTYIRLYETVFRELKNRWYGGVGLAIDYHSKIIDERLDLNSEPPFYTSHYLYSNLRDFSTEHYSANGFILKALYDDRDNAINPYKGVYFDVGLRINQSWLGSSKNSSQLLFELRNYRKVGSKTNRVAVWIIGQFLTSGTLPYLALPSIGWDTYNRSGRGYIQGRFRGENLAYGEVEYRYRISKNELLSGVLFLNTISVDNPLADQQLFNRFAFGYGAGLRVKMNKETRTNICIDLGFGQNGSAGLYFGIQEAF